MQSLHIKNYIENNDDTNLHGTRFGGQPAWLQQAEWPLSRSTGQPMTFIGQVAIDDDLFPNSPAKMAYLFISGSAEDYVENTYKADAGENAVILQPGDNSFIKVTDLSHGPSVSENTFLVTTERASESSEDDAFYGSKIGGIPLFIQDEEYPGRAKDWNLLLQLSAESAPFELDFGDMGTGYAFLSIDGTRAKFIWQCA